jgi:hypothetical protein
VPAAAAGEGIASPQSSDSDCVHRYLVRDSHRLPHGSQ